MSVLQNALRWFRDEDPIQAVLEKLAIFQELSPRDLRMVIESLERRQVPEGKSVFQQGDSSQGLCIVLSGAVGLLMGDEDGTQTCVGRALEGESFSELALLDEAPQTASAVATQSAEIAVFHRTALLALARRNPTLGIRIVMQLSQIVADRLRRTNRSLRETREDLSAAEEARKAAEEAEEGAEGDSKEADVVPEEDAAA